MPLFGDIGMLNTLHLSALNALSSFCDTGCVATTTLCALDEKFVTHESLRRSVGVPTKMTSGAFFRSRACCWDCAIMRVRTAVQLFELMNAVLKIEV